VKPAYTSELSDITELKLAVKRYIDDPVIRNFVSDLPDKLSQSKAAMVGMVVHAAMHNDEKSAYKLMAAVKKIE
jgi:hypothetical protein